MADAAAILSDAAAWIAGAATGMADAVARAAAQGDAVPLDVATVRLGAALVLGGLIGLERERRQRPAGLRTHMLVALAACLFAVTAEEVASGLGDASDNLRVDPTRVVEAVTAGVAFLAAGSIFRAGDSVKGLTTGAGLWLAGAVGVACGLGHLAVSAVAVAIALIVLALLRLLEP